jgi:hypothetical protein
MFVRRSANDSSQSRSQLTGTSGTVLANRLIVLTPVELKLVAVEAKGREGGVPHCKLVDQIIPYGLLSSGIAPFLPFVIAIPYEQPGNDEVLESCWQRRCMRQRFEECRCLWVIRVRKGSSLT